MGGIRVIGLGNVLMGDDAFGPYMIQALQASLLLPRAVELLDLGTPGLDLIPFLAGTESIIILDTVRSEGRPGELRRYGREDLLRQPPGPRLGPHDPGLREALAALELSGTGPREILLIGAIPDSVAMGARLSPAMRQAIEPAVIEVTRELRRRGVRVARRDSAARPDVWWENAPEGAH